MTTNGFLLERDAAALVDAGHRPLQRLDRLAAARPLLRDDPPRRAAAGAARARGARRVPGGAPDQGQRGRDARLHRAGGAAVRASSRASTPTRCASSSSCRSTPTAPGRRDQVLTGDEIRAAIDARLPARARAARAERDRARLPLRRRPGPDRLHQPGQRAVLRRLQPHPHHRRRAACAPACSRSTRPTCASRCAPGASDDELEQIIRDAVWRKELKHHVNEPGLRAAGAHDVRDRRLTAVTFADAVATEPDRPVGIRCRAMLVRATMVAARRSSPSSPAPARRSPRACCRCCPRCCRAGATGGRRRPLGIVLGLAITFTITIVGLADGRRRRRARRRRARARSRSSCCSSSGSRCWCRRSATGSRRRSRAWRASARARRGDGFWSGARASARALGFVYAPCAGPILAAVISVGAGARASVVAVGARLRARARRSCCSRSRSAGARARPDPRARAAARRSSARSAS